MSVLCLTVVPKTHSKSVDDPACIAGVTQRSLEVMQLARVHLLHQAVFCPCSAESDPDQPQRESTPEGGQRFGGMAAGHESMLVCQPGRPNQKKVRYSCTSCDLQFTALPSPTPTVRCPRNCTEAHNMGMSNMHTDHPCYKSKLDGDGDGIACKR